MRIDRISPAAVGLLLIIGRLAVAGDPQAGESPRGSASPIRYAPSLHAIERIERARSHILPALPSPHPEGLDLGALLQNLRDMKRRDRHARRAPSDRGDLIIGDDPPDEQFVIQHDTTIIANIQVINRGLLRVQGATLSLAGDLELRDAGQLQVDGGGINVLEEWLYQFQCVLSDSARLEITDSQVTFSGQNWGLTGIGASHIRLERVGFPAGFLTTLLLQQAEMSVDACTKPGEYITMDSTRLQFSGCDSILVWLTFPDSSEGMLELPAFEDPVPHWEFPAEFATGIDYQVTIDSTSHVWSGILSSNGSSVTIENSELIACGIIFWEGTGDTIHVSGLLDGLEYDDFTLGLQDRTLRVINSRVDAWNVYPFDSTSVKLENSIFGETLTSDDARIEVWGSICDGHGGYVGASGRSEMLFATSSIVTQTIARDRSVMLIYETALPGYKVSASGSAIMALLNSIPALRPAVEDTAVILENVIGLPSVTPVNARIAVTGTAMITPGPYNPFSMDYYALSYGQGVDPEEVEWVPIDSVQGSVLMDTLAVWDTQGLPPGSYLLRLVVSSTYVDTFRLSMPLYRSVYLSEGTGIDPGEGESGLLPPRETALFQNSPNPFNPATEIRFFLEESGPVVLRIYDMRGRLVRTLLDRMLPEGAHTCEWNGTDDRGAGVPSGIYLYRLAAAGESLTRKMVLAK